MNEQTPLDILSPNLVGVPTRERRNRISAFNAFLKKGAFETATQAQIDDLEDVWQALHTHNRYKGKKGKKKNKKFLESESLKKLFEKVATAFQATIFQKPIVVSEAELVQTKIDDAHHFEVSGNSVPCVRLENYLSLSASFSFLLVNTKDKYIIEDTKVSLAHKYCFPLIQIHHGIAQLSDTIDLEAILTPLQEVFSCANHDYLHQLTMPYLNPIFLPHFKEKTLVGHKHGNRELFAVYRQLSGLQDRDWTSGNTNTGSYEYFVMFAHSVLYNHYLHDGPVGEKLTQMITHLFDGLEDAQERLKQKDKEYGADITGFYFSTLAGFAIFRLVDHTHPLAQHFYKNFNRLSFDPDFLEQQIKYAHEYMPKETLEQGVHLVKQPSHYLRAVLTSKTEKSLSFLFSDNQKARNAREIVLSELQKIIKTGNADMAAVMHPDNVTAFEKSVQAYYRRQERMKRGLKKTKDFLTQDVF